MSGRQPSQRRGDDHESIADFMARRARETGDFVGRAYERGREEWDKATREGRALLATRPSDVVAVGRQAIQAAGRGMDEQLGNSRAARTAAGAAGWVAGRQFGPGRAALRTAADLSAANRVARQMLNPLDPRRPATVIAMAQGLEAAGEKGAAYLADRAAHPEHLGQDVRNVGHKVNVDFNPFGAPMAATPSAEFARQFRVGMNHGELEANVDAFAVGGGEARAIARAVGASEAMTAAKLVERGYGPAKAAELAETYVGMGAHYPISRALGRKLGLPQWVIDSPLNVSKPKVSRYEAYKGHYETDDSFHGARMKGRGGRGSGFSGQRAGFTRREGLDRVWHGLSDTAKAVGGEVLGLPVGMSQAGREDEPW